MIVDASVAVKWLIDEPGSDAADRLLVGGGLGSPDLIFAEVANTLWKAWRRGDFAELPGGIATLADCFQHVMPCATLMMPAARLAVELDHPAYDCFYLAMAIAEDVPLVTADRRFLAACARTAHAARVRALT
ncbi:MAG: VapC toxin family PIN domain ribonuclease [Alphaproteobacteria bacterium PA4]|nr:MAG: VapC toxin family PIN domain ribonuclease [Alphaproteobacteria bacterium PA4]